ncbi:MAG: hypothetical protein WA639_02030, partial [Candidatus Acidiferrum sp.]
MTQQERSRNAWKKWQELVSEQARSGQSVAAFCRGRKLCAPHFFWWKKRLRASSPGKFVEVKVTPRVWRPASEARTPRGQRGAGSAAGFPAAEISRGGDHGVRRGEIFPAGDARVEIRLGNGRSLVVGRGFDAEQ